MKTHTEEWEKLPVTTSKQLDIGEEYLPSTTLMY